MKHVLPKGPIGFKVYGIGFMSGNPNVFAQVNTEIMNFIKKLDYWFLDGTEKLNETEQEMLNEIWEKECKKKGLK